MWRCLSLYYWPADNDTSGRSMIGATIKSTILYSYPLPCPRKPCYEFQISATMSPSLSSDYRDHTVFSPAVHVATSPSTAPPTRAHLTVSYSNALCLQLILPLNTPLRHPFNTFFTLTLPSSWVLRPPHISHRLDFLVFICLPLLLQIRDRPLITCSKKWRCRR